MNILYCGDRNIEDGLIISVLSLLKNVSEELDIYVLTMSFATSEKEFLPVRKETISFLDGYIKEKNERNKICLIDITEEFKKEIPVINIDTRFTPYCMLRLFADKVEQIPKKILYLDNDVVCRKDCSEFYHQAIEGHELAGVLDYYGKWFFRRRLLHMDYLNSCVLLLNLDEIRRTGLFERCRERCINKKMFMPDQSAINKLSVSKKICRRKYNEQRRLKKNTVLQHFTTSFRFFPWLHTITVKPWQIADVHEKLKIREYDDILNEYADIKERRLA